MAGDNWIGTAECIVVGRRAAAAASTGPVLRVSACSSAAEVADRHVLAADTGSDRPASDTEARWDWRATNWVPGAAEDGRSGREPAEPPISA